MSKPDDIPADVWAAANAVWDECAMIADDAKCNEILARAILADRKSRAEVAALFIHNRLYRPDFPVCSYHSRDIHKAVMEVTPEELEAAKPQPWAPLIPLDDEAKSND